MYFGQNDRNFSRKTLTKRLMIRGTTVWPIWLGPFLLVTLENRLKHIWLLGHLSHQSHGSDYSFGQRKGMHTPEVTTVLYYFWYKPDSFWNPTQISTILLHRYQLVSALLFRDDCAFLCLDDKHWVKVGFLWQPGNMEGGCWLLVIPHLRQEIMTSHARALFHSWCAWNHPWFLVKWKSASWVERCDIWAFIPRKAYDWPPLLGGTWLGQ